jgi:hypothetical protein
MLLRKEKNSPWGKAEASLSISAKLQALVPFLLTHTFVPRVKQLCQRSCGPLSFNSFRSLLVLSKLTEDPCSYSLDIFNRRIKQLRKKHINKT